ncbi:MAG TPA: hypothetical protein VII76_10740 [Acidimicrobiales bacterium]
MTCRRSPRRGARRRDRHGLPRAGRAAVAVCTLAVVAGGLGGCASHDGNDLARQACQHVEQSLTLYRASLHAPSPAQASTQQAQASSQLRDALPLAATAAGEAGQYQALMATLSESDHLPESLLVHALGAQCGAADSDGGISPTPPPTAQTPATRPPPTGL